MDVPMKEQEENARQPEGSEPVPAKEIAKQKTMERLKKSAKMAEKLQRKRKTQETDETTDLLEEEQSVADHDLVPLPQPNVETLLHGQEDKKRTRSLQALPDWIANPTVVAPSTTVQFAELGLSKRLVELLAQNNITQGFAVQAGVIPLLLQSSNKSIQRAHAPGDLCVSAATGSGKTLAYVLPIIECLRTCIVTRLRCAVVVPTKELVVQVAKSFEQYCSGTKLRVCALTGQRSLAFEQSLFLSPNGKDYIADIMVTTPGRFVDHIRSTPNFTLQHLRYLVVDEADRLLDQSFQGWVNAVMEELERPKVLQGIDMHGLSGIERLPGADSNSGCNIASTYLPNMPTLLPQKTAPCLQKLVFSATLTRNPAKISALRLVRPRLLVVQDPSVSMEPDGDEEDTVLFSLPAALQEHHVGVTAEKPLLLYHLLRTQQLQNTLCFTKSNESAARLYRLLELLDKGSSEPLRVGLFAGILTRADRRRILTQFAESNLQLLVCSDLMARGVDLPSTENVINYDPPSGTRQYVHRIGRCARAGREGHAWTLVQDHEGFHFSSIVRRLTRTLPVQRMRLTLPNVDPVLVKKYDDALSTLKSEVYEAKHAHN
ncbi:ATP-dependent RNA helicase Dbp6 [Schizosaccharomyces japonicus yFS275]|uniref:ATP-dependent RNA helicase n=1 Tax=Schizosaccharomyces japonicus (strain yFS275 / FY16936) TaxID=402676 RepID=B6K4C4_SCHJY|nr:ATP-dependent RNA helicase Dbp6 [Schizosaccharomyces japonicus yFS275]EEB08331.2 ATP-dependent RNA helicase Dbp6 [Schizosaccharomyces japonicus yFS275]